MHASPLLAPHPILKPTQMISQPKPSYFHSLIFPSSTPPTSESLQKILLPPPPPLAGYLSFIPPTPSAVRINSSGIISQYRDAIKSLSERLGTDKWFLGSRCVLAFPNKPAKG